MWMLLNHEGIAIETLSRDWSYAELRERVLERSVKWQNQAQVGQTVRILDSVVVQQIISIFACVQVGLIPTLSDSESVPADFESTEDTLSKTREVGHRFDPSVAMIFTTSGTTSKCRIVGHRSSSIVQCAEDMNQVLGMDASTRTALILPLSFHYGFSMVTSTFRVGGTILIPNQYDNLFELPHFFEHAHPTMIGTVPHCWTILLRMLSPSIWSRLQTCILAGDECSVALLNQLSQQNRAMSLHIFYGSTEVLRTCHRLWQPCDPQGCIGTTLPSVQLHQTSSGTMQRGATIFQEIVEGGRTIHSSPSQWLLSDELRLDASDCWHFVARSDDIIKVAGIRISPAEIETLIQQHVGVLDVVVGQVNNEIIAVLHWNKECQQKEEIEMPRHWNPRYWIVLNQPFDQTERFKRSRKRILQYATHHHPRSSNPPENLVVRHG
jgi:acyl-coenzyme A synthetase/AMP-(fatty) acid ligase